MDLFSLGIMFAAGIAVLAYIGIQLLLHHRRPKI